MTRTLFAVLLLLIASATTVGRAAAAAKPQVLFDDFTYTKSTVLKAWQHGWKVRIAQGWPGVSGASWPVGGISSVPDPANRRNRLLRLSSSTNGTAAGTTQAQICQQRKFFEGTYATRVRFSDAPTSGPDGDQIVETFYTISPLQAPLDPNYSELDWEYLPNAGWGMNASTLFVTSWETARLDPWLADNTYTTVTRSLDGWHTLVLQVANGTLMYYLDGALVAQHGGRYYPEVPMSINYNLWFIDGGLLPPGQLRRYDEDVDWVYYQAGVALAPQQIAAQVAKLRRARIAFRGTVPAENPPLESPCNF